MLDKGDFFLADIEWVEPVSSKNERELDVLVRSVLTLFDQYVKLNKKVPSEMLSSLSGIEDPGRLADTIAAHMALKLEDKQKILAVDDISVRLESLMGLIEGEIDVLQIEKRIRGRVKQQMEKSQSWVNWKMCPMSMRSLHAKLLNPECPKRRTKKRSMN
jgi:ATP-dependent Lon protease